MARVLSFHYTLTDTTGKKLDQSGTEPLSFIEGSHQIIPGLESELSTLKKGDKKKISVPAAKAYGVRRQELMISVPRDKFPAGEIKVGDRFRGGPEASAPLFTVISISGTEVKLDGNHSLSGQDLVFDVELVGIRESTEQELSHGHAHGEAGHSH